MSAAPTPPPCGGSLVDRAITAARTAALLVPAGRTDMAWHDRAARAVRILASTLGIHPADVLARPDPTRRYGFLNAPEVLLHINNAGASHADGFGDDLQFIPEIGRTDVFLRLMPCPECRQLVPTHRITSLADLGRHLDPDRASTRRLAPDTEQFATDPEHTPACSRRRPAGAYGTSHRHA
jgi:hypothetical protein